MYKPNFVLVGGVAKVTNQHTKDYVAEMQLAGNYSAIEEILMHQFKSMGNEDRVNEKQFTHGANPIPT